MPDQDYHDGLAAGMDLADRVRGYCATVGRNVTVGVTQGRNAPRFTVTEQGHSKIPLATWSPAWDGWLAKAEEACMDAGLLPTMEEMMGTATKAEVDRSNVLRGKLSDLVQRAGGRAKLVKVAVAVMHDKRVEPFGGWAAKTPAETIGNIQVEKFLADVQPTSMLANNLDKWEAILPALEEHFASVASAPVEVPVPAQLPVVPTLVVPTPAEDDEVGPNEAARDEELTSLRVALEATTTDRDNLMRRVNELQASLRETGAAVVRLEDEARVAAAGPETGLAQLHSLPAAAITRTDPLEYESPPEYPQMAAVHLSAEIGEIGDPVKLEHRRRYGDALLRLLDRDGVDPEPIMSRLDVLAGLPAAG